MSYAIAASEITTFVIKLEGLKLLFLYLPLHSEWNLNIPINLEKAW